MAIDFIRVIEPRTEDDSSISRPLSAALKGCYRSIRRARLDVLTRLLWNELSASDSLDTANEEASLQAESQEGTMTKTPAPEDVDLSPSRNSNAPCAEFVRRQGQCCALAIYMRDRVPEMEYVFHDTDKELPETYDYLDRLAAILGKPIAKTSPVDTFDHWLVVYGGMLPSNHRRWCTKMLKIKPFENFVGDSSVINYVGLRADETGSVTSALNPTSRRSIPFRRTVWFVPTSFAFSRILGWACRHTWNGGGPARGAIFASTNRRSSGYG